MNSNIKTTDKIDSLWLLKMIAKWRKQLVITFVVAVVVSFIFTLPAIMTPVFKSTAVIYPVNMSTYSKETPTEQMVQLLNSDDIKFELIRAFGLYKRYGVDSTGSNPKFEIFKVLKENVSISKTPLESIEISVLDKDPIIAAQMCDSILSFMDKKALSLIRERSNEVIVILNNQIQDKVAQMDSMDRAIKDIRMKYGITEFEEQIAGFSREYYKSLSSGSVNSKMEQTKNNLEEKGGEYVDLKEHLFRARGAYNDLKVRYDQVVIDSKKVMKFHNVITAPIPADKKEFPKRSFIMLLFTFSVMLFAILIIIYQEKYKRILQEEFKDL
jgi:uncharacterized protein involved in exopolysaccharide biosynthesis